MAYVDAGEILDLHEPQRARNDDCLIARTENARVLTTKANPAIVPDSTIRRLALNDRS